ncbi:MAG TPA: PilZ domain-containing protein [Terriglobales bacterium]|nr:PilZ domain-containing protein [Terriglobales bacterium]
MKPFSPPRRWVRQTVDLPVKIGVYQDSEAVLVPGLVTELSEGGMSLYAGMALKPGDLLEVEFQMPIARTVQAVVRNKTGFNFGLEFVERLRG